MRAARGATAPVHEPRGEEPFFASADSINACGEPLHSFLGATLLDGALGADGGTVGFNVAASSPLLLHDSIVSGSTPDLDLDGDGLERFDLDAEGYISRCIDGDRTLIDGRDCWSASRIADGFAVTLRMLRVPATFAGRVPGWEELFHEGCPEPPERSLWEPPTP